MQECYVKLCPASIRKCLLSAVSQAYARQLCVRDEEEGNESVCFWASSTCPDSGLSVQHRVCSVYGKPSLSQRLKVQDKCEALVA